MIEGTDPGASHKGRPAHFVYAFERLVSVDGKPPEIPQTRREVTGTVVRFNYARHGVANGFVLDSGDFVHTRPDGFKRSGLKVGDKVRAEGEVRALVTGTGQVIEAHTVNGKPMNPAL